MVEQEQLTQLMQYVANLNQIPEQILNLIANSSVPSSVLLEDVAATVGESFQVEACIVVFAPENSPQNLMIGLWHEKNCPIKYNQLLQQSCCDLLNQAPQNQFTLKEAPFPDIFASSMASLAAIFKSKTNGALILLKSEPYFWKSSEKQQLEIISQSLGITFSHLQLQQQIQTKNRYQNLLTHLSTAISESSDLKMLFNLALSEVGKALKIDRAKIITVKYQDPFFIQRKRKQQIKATLTVTETWSATDRDIMLPEKFSFQLTNSLCFQQALEQAPQPLVVQEGVVFPDLATEFLPEGVKPASSSGLLMMPLMGKRSSENQPALILGFLVLQKDFFYSWNDQEIDLIKWISVQLSTALIHHQTLNQVQSLVEERTSQLQWSLDVQAKLSERMRQQIEQLKKLNELKDDFLSSMSHELKTPMTSMKMAIKMLRQNIPDMMKEKYLDILEQEWNREYNLIKDLLTLQQVESGELTFTPQELNLNHIIDNLASSFKEKWCADKGLTLETNLSDSNLRFYSDFESLNHILNELLLNAAKYSDVDTTVSLFAQTRRTLTGKEVEITVHNYGVAIEANELPYIFDKFRRGKGVTDRAVPGTGLGLTLVKHLVENLNGNIDVSSDAVDDSEIYKTTFTIILPQQ